MDKTPLSATPPWTEEVDRRIPADGNPAVRRAFPRFRRKRDVLKTEADDVDRRPGAELFIKFYRSGIHPNGGVC